MFRAIPFLAAASLVAAASPLPAQESAMTDTIRYRLSWDNPASQLYTVEASAVVDGPSIVFSLPTWRPGRYVLQNYAANVQRVRASDEAGRTLDVEWTDLDSWRVATGGAREVTLAYEYHAATLDAGSSWLAPGVAYFNPVNLLPWVEGRMDRPTILVLDAPADWDVATQLERVSGEGFAFVAEDYHRLVDSPTIAAEELTVWEFVVDDVVHRLTFRDLPDLGALTREEILADVEALTREQTAIFGGAPFEEYWHLYQFVGFPIGHAVEHANSASYVFSRSLLPGGYVSFLGTTSHELFHAWNVKRIRPAAMWPYDYSTPQLTRLHWVNEGVTSYYDDLVLARAGILSTDEYFEGLGRAIGALQSSPGRLVTPVSLASWTSWHTGYGAGHPGRSVSFYTKGALLGLLLDLAIRDATDGERSLDDVMRLLWREHYLQERGYPEDGFQAAVEAVAGRDFDVFFAAYVDGTDELPYDEYLGVVGLATAMVEDPAAPAVRIGVTLDGGSDRVELAEVAPDGPALAAGLMAGDVLVEVDGDAVASGSDVVAAIADRSPGETIPVVVERGGERVTRDVTLAGGGNLRWAVRPVEDPTPRQLRLRGEWLASVAGR